MRTSAATLSLAPAALVPAVAGLLLTLLLAALDATIVSTALPSIADDLRGFERYSWVTVAYLLTSTISVPVVGKLADQYGRRVFLLGGALTFLASSILCALAGSFEQLVTFRLVQGVGAGTITAAVFAAAPRLFSPAAAARLVGLFSGSLMDSRASSGHCLAASSAMALAGAASSGSMSQSPWLPSRWCC